MHSINDISAKLEPIKSAKEDLVMAFRSQIAKGIDCIDAKEAGEVTDMIKDLAETEKLCYEACYYKTVIEAMEEVDDEPMYDDNMSAGYTRTMPRMRMGYNNRRMSNGQYASRGRGHVSGYNRPYVDQEPYIDNYLNDPNFKRNMRYGYSDNESMEETVDHSVETIKDIWQDARPELRKKMKEDLQKLVSEM